MRVLLVSTYELGHQPVHVATPAGALRAAGHEVKAIDLSVEPWDDGRFRWADRVAFSVPMHTAMRLAVAAARRLRADRPEVPVCLYGLYAPVSRDRTAGSVADALLAGEYLSGLVAWAAGDTTEGLVRLERDADVVAARDLLPPLDRYARLVLDDEERLAGCVETTRGCSHRCRHCPIPTVYDGRLRRAELDVVLADVAQLVAMGARHVTFGDADFLNAPGHARRVVDAVHTTFPEVTFDCTAKVDHVLAFGDAWAGFADAGCLFVVSAFESVDDDVLRRLDKGHTAADASRAVGVLRAAGIEPRPSWLPFNPWSDAGDVADILEFVAAHDLVPNVDPVQYAIRLLLPEGSLLLDDDVVRSRLDRYDAEGLSWTWTAVDPAVDELHASVRSLVEASCGRDPAPAYEEVRRLVFAEAGRPGGVTTARGRRARAGVARPRLTEAWFCCSEPTSAQLVGL